MGPVGLHNPASPDVVQHAAGVFLTRGQEPGTGVHGHRSYRTTWGVRAVYFGRGVETGLTRQGEAKTKTAVLGSRQGKHAGELNGRVLVRGATMEWGLG